MPQAASTGVRPSGSATRDATASCAFAREIGMAPSSSALGLRWPSTTSASVSVGSTAAAAVAGRTRIGAGALRPDLEHAELDRRDAAAAGADGLDIDRVGAQRMPRHRHFRLEQRPARQHRHVGRGAAGVEGDDVVDALDVAEMAAADDAGDRAGHHGLDRRATPACGRLPRRRRISSSARASAGSAAATALPARADSATPAGRYRHWRRSRRCARIRAIPD